MENKSSDKIAIVSPKDNKDIVWKWSVAIIGIFSIIVLIFIKLQNENFEWGLFILLLEFCLLWL